jgi:hypothetical protein
MLKTSDMGIGIADRRVGLKLAIIVRNPVQPEPSISRSGAVTSDRNREC